MKLNSLDNMVNGWFIGGFDPSVIKTTDVEVAVKEYSKGDAEERHYHKIATELTVVVSGRIKMNGTVYSKGSIVVIEPNESTDFYALESSVCTVVKYPGTMDDKYLGEPKND